MRKRIISLALAVVIICTMLPQIYTGTVASSAQWDVINVKKITGNDIVAQARTYLGVPYDTSGGNYKYRTGFGSTMMFDCSGFVYRVCRDVGLASSRQNYSMGQNDTNGQPLEGKDAYGNYYITAHTQEQRYYGQDISDAVKKYLDTGDYSELCAGDLLFISNNNSNVTHVAIYTGDGKIIHSEGYHGCVAEHPISRYHSSNNKNNWYFAGCRLVEQSYVGQCNSYPTYCSIKISSSTTYVKSLPYSKATDPNSLDVEKASKGDSYQAIGLVENTAGNLWYKVTAKNGSVGYIYAGDTQYVAQSIHDIKGTGITAPTNHIAGSSYVLTGTVSSTYNQLTAVSAYVYAGTSEQGTIETGDTASVSGNYFSLGGSSIDKQTKFGSLPVGTHTFVVWASYKNYYAKSATSLEMNTGEHAVYYNTFQVVDSTTSNRPGKPTLKVSVSDDCATFTWGATANTTHYNMWIQKQDASGEWREVVEQFYAWSGMSVSLETGKYRASMTASNSNAYEADGSDWVHTWADDVYFVIEPNTYTVSYDANGGTGAPSWQTAQHGISMTLADTVPDRFAYNFEGWALTEDAEWPDYQPGENILLDRDMTLYAVWRTAERLDTGSDNWINVAYIPYPDTGVYYQVKPDFNSNFRLAGNPYYADEDTQAYLYDKDGVLLASDDDSGINRNFQLDYSFVGGETYYLYVRFYDNTLTGSLYFDHMRGYTICYDTMGGENAPASFQHYHGTSSVLSEAVPVKNGYIFKGWATDSAATSPQYMPGDTFAVDFTTTLYAVWECLHEGHNQDGECKNCGMEIHETYRYEFEATCTTPAVTKYLCLQCDYEELLYGGEPLGHDYMSFNGEPTCEEEGYTYSSCMRCGEVFEDRVIPTIGHAYRDGECIYCGKLEIEVMLGDLTGDLEITSADTVLLARYLVGEAELNDQQLQAADVNGDGEVTSADTVRLGRYLAGLVDSL